MKNNSLRNAAWIAGTYLVVGHLYIWLSDALVERAFQGELAAAVQTAKGWTFITVTALLLFVAMHRTARARYLDYTRRLDLQNEALESHEQTIRAFVGLIEARDADTAGHTRRVARYCDAIAGHMGFSSEEIALLRRAAELHDIGKIQTPDAILLKPGPLTSREYDLVKDHVTVGYEMLSVLRLYKEIAEIMRHHHERFDGRGYPQGLAGDAIPLLAHVMIVADALDAMTSDRIYRPRRPFAAAAEEIARESGRQFHPRVVEATLAVLPSLPEDEFRPTYPPRRAELDRMAYFYRDQLSGCLNQKYLDYLLSHADLPRPPVATLVRVRGLDALNERESWANGDALLRSFADLLLQTLPEALCFRVHGNRFIVLSEHDVEIVIRTLTERFASVRFDVRTLPAVELGGYVASTAA